MCRDGRVATHKQSHRWSIDWGAQENFLIAIERETGKTPKALLSRTILYPDLNDVAEAFFQLSPSRTIHMGGVGFIPISEISAYMGLAGVAPDDRLEFLKCIQAMDAVYVEANNSKDDEQGAEGE